MEPCWGRGQGQLGVFETKTETEIEAKTEGEGGESEGGEDMEPEVSGSGWGGCVPYTQGPRTGPFSLSWVRISEPSLGLVPPQLAPAWGGMG